MISDEDQRELDKLWLKVTAQLNIAHDCLTTRKCYESKDYLDYLEYKEYGSALTELWEWALLLDADEVCWNALESAQRLLFGEET